MSQAAPALESRWQEFLRHRRMVAAYLRALVGEPADADDLFQEVGLAVMQASAVPQDAAEFPRWCRGVARNVVLHHWRTRRRSRLRFEMEYLELVDRAYDESAPTSNTEPAGQREGALARCLEKLGTADRDVLDRRFVRGETAEEIGRAAGRSAEAIRMKLMRLRQALARCVQRRLATAGEASW